MRNLPTTTSSNARWMPPTASPVFAAPSVVRASSTDRTASFFTWITYVFNYACAIAVARLGASSTLSDGCGFVSGPKSRLPGRDCIQRRYTFFTYHRTVLQCIIVRKSGRASCPPEGHRAWSFLHCTWCFVTLYNFATVHVRTGARLTMHAS